MERSKTLIAVTEAACPCCGQMVQLSISRERLVKILDELARE